MAITQAYKLRHGNAISRIGAGASQTGIIIWTFGYETQEIDMCEGTLDVMSSKEMCMLGGNYFSAQYKAHPGKTDGNLVYNMVRAFKPVYHQGTPQEGTGSALCDF